MPISALPAMRAAIAYSAPAAASSVAWYLANGTIDAAEVEQTGENVTTNTAYTGSQILTTAPWTVAFKLTAYTPGVNVVLWQSHSSQRVLVTLLTNGNIRFATPAGNIDIAHGDTNRVWFFINDGSTQTTAYQDNISGGTGGLCRIDSAGYFDGSAVTFDFVAAYNIALDATQRSELYAAMTA